jgi:hypothetical protein
MFTRDDGWGLISNALLLTHNGGKDWFSVPLSQGQLDDHSPSYFLNVNTIYLVAPAPDGNGGQLYFSKNGGGTWRVTPVPFIRGQLAFIDTIGYFLQTTRTGNDAMLGILFTSTDNGETWVRINPEDAQTPATSLPEAGIKTGFAFINANRGWLGIADQPQKVLIYKTENGGRDWSPQVIPVPQNIATLVGSSLPPTFFNGDSVHGLLPVKYVSPNGSDTNLVFYSTTDSGTNWTPGDSVVDGQAYTFLDPKTGWVWGKRGLYFTNDGAKTWQVLPVAFGRSEHATSIDFIDVETGWLLTADAKNRVRIYTTSDGGNTWTAINP